jgi:hypothetical protein
MFIKGIKDFGIIYNLAKPIKSRIVVPLYGVVAYNTTHKTVEKYAFYAKKAVFCLWLWATTPDNGSAHKA